MRVRSRERPIDDEILGVAELSSRKDGPLARRRSTVRRTLAFDASGNSEPVQRSERMQRLQDHEIQRSLQHFRFLCVLYRHGEGTEQLSGALVTPGTFE